MEKSTDHINFINPFNIQVDPMERLLLVNFQKDPDSIYIGFEPQVFNDHIHGNGHIVIGWRADGKIDVYHEPQLRLNKGSYDIAGKGLQHMTATPMEKATYEITNSGVRAQYKFKDRDQREIEIEIEETNPRKRQPFGLLAPMGDAAEKPSSLPLVYLTNFYFVRKKHTKFKISINNRLHKPDSLPLPMDLTAMYFTRYSPRPIIATLNPEFEGELKPLSINQKEKVQNLEDLTLEMVYNNIPELKSITRFNTVFPVKLSFTPAFPSLYNIADGAEKKGKIIIQSEPSTGSISGQYRVVKNDGSINITMKPSGGWKPKITKFSLWFLYRVAKIFKQWPKTYTWEAKLEQNRSNQWFMSSRWIRKGRILK